MNIIPLEVILSLIIITSSPAAKFNEDEAFFYSTPVVMHFIANTAASVEILDPRETRWDFVNSDFFLTDLQKVRRSYLELLNTPRLAESRAFPDIETVKANLEFNREFKGHIETRLKLGFETYNEYLFLEIMQECDEAYASWDLLRDSLQTYYYTPMKRKSLRSLREKIGFAAFCSGNMPTCVPLHYFSRLD